MNNMVVNAFAPHIDDTAKEFHLREYKYEGDETKADALINKLYTERFDEMRVRIGTVSESFITVTDGYGNPLKTCEGYGGKQEWFTDNMFGYDVNIDGMGCGAIAAINQYLYLSGVRTIKYSEYKQLLDDYLNGRDADFFDGRLFVGWERRAAINSPFGALPSQITDYVTNMCGKDNIMVYSSWDVFDDYEKDYTNMQKQLERGVPVVWAVYDYNTDNDGIKNNGIPFYTYDETTGEYDESGNRPSSHYVTATAIYENPADPDHRRMVEVSSWGNRYYVDYDEYVEWAEKNSINQPFSSITNTYIMG